MPILTYRGQEAGLLPVNGHAWKDSEQPLEQRGIEGGFFCQFFREIDSYRDRMTRNHELSFSRDDVVDPPDWKPSWRDDLTSRRLVADHIFPWTKSISAPLYARIPEASRGQPNIYLSYPWDAPLLASGYGVIETMGECLKAGDCIWMDVFCHDQHRVGSAVPQIEKVVGHVQCLFLPMSEPPWFERCWCIWEVMCALRANKEIVFIEYARKQRDMYRIRKYFLSQFSQVRSISLAEASVAEDKALILRQVQSIFGSIEAADTFLLSKMKDKMNEVIGDTREPWERSK